MIYLYEVIMINNTLKHYMMSKIKIISKLYGTQEIDLDTFSANNASSNSTIFRVVEHIFNDWYEYNTEPGAPMGKDIIGMYYGEGDQPAIYSKRGAIIGGIENFLELVSEDNGSKSVYTTKDIVKMDIEAAFE